MPIFAPGFDEQYPILVDRFRSADEQLSTFDTDEKEMFISNAHLPKNPDNLKVLIDVYELLGWSIRESYDGLYFSITPE